MGGGLEKEITKKVGFRKHRFHARLHASVGMTYFLKPLLFYSPSISAALISSKSSMALS